MKTRFRNRWEYSNERHEYCKLFEYDILGLGELHNTQGKGDFKDKRKYIVHKLTIDYDESILQSQDGSRFYLVSTTIERLTHVAEFTRTSPVSATLRKIYWMGHSSGDQTMQVPRQV